MSRRAPLFVALAALVAIAVYFALPGSTKLPSEQGLGDTQEISEQPLQIEGQEQAPSPQVEAPKPVLRVAEEGAQPAEAEDPPSYRRHLAELRGRILWEHDGSPVADVEVRCFELSARLLAADLQMVLDQSFDFDPAKPKGKTRTDDEGRFVLEGVHSREMLLLGIDLRGEAQAVRFVDDGPRPGEVKDIGDLLLEQRGGLKGQVVDDRGQPVAGARVRAVDLPAIVMNVGVGRFDPKGLIATNMMGDAMTLIIAMPKWVQRIYDDLPFPMAMTDREGRFELRGIRPGRPTLVVHKEQLPVRTRDVRVRAGQVRELSATKMPAGETLRGKVVDSAGEPVPEAEITAGSILPMVPVALLPRPILTNAKGEFELTGLGRGKQVVAYRVPGLPGWQHKWGVQAGKELTLVVPALHDMALRVTNEGGQPIEDATLAVGVMAAPVPMPGFTKWLDADTHVERSEDKPGVFRLKQLSETTHQILVNAPGYAARSKVVEIKKDSQVDVSVTLERAPEFTIEVRDPGGQPVHAARVYWRGPRARSMEDRQSMLSQMPILVGKTDENGRIVTGSVPLGAQRFIAEHPGFAPGYSGEQSVIAGTIIRIAMIRPGRIDGRLTEHGKAPEESKMVMLQPDWQTRSNMGEMVMPQFTASRPDGSFEFGGLLPGGYRIEVLPRMNRLGSPMDIYDMVRVMEAGARVPRESTNVPLGGTARVQIEIVPQEIAKGTGRIYGNFRVNGQVPEEILVRLRGKSRGAAELDKLGNFEFTGLADGQYRLSFRRADRRNFQDDSLHSVGVEIKDGISAPVQVDLRTGNLRIELLDEDGAALAGQPVRVRSQSVEGRRLDSGVNLTGSCDEQGVVSFEDVPVGVYEVYASGGPRGRPVLPEHRITVQAGRETVQKLKAMPTYTLKGRIEYELGGLSPEELAIVGDKRPTWISGSQRGNWVRVRQGRGADEGTFTIQGAAAGELTLQAWSDGVRWRSDKLQVSGDNAAMILRLRPDKKMLERQVESRRNSKKAAEAGRKR